MAEENGHGKGPLEQLTYDLLIQTDPCATCGQMGALMVRTRRVIAKKVTPLVRPGGMPTGQAAVEGTLELVVIHSRCLVCGRYRQLVRSNDGKVVEAQSMERWLGPLLGDTKTTL